MEFFKLYFKFILTSIVAVVLFFFNKEQVIDFLKDEEHFQTVLIISVLIANLISVFYLKNQNLYLKNQIREVAVSLLIHRVSSIFNICKNYKFITDKEKIAEIDALEEERKAKKVNSQTERYLKDLLGRVDINPTDPE